MGAFGSNYGSNFAGIAVSVLPSTKTVTADLCVTTDIKNNLCINETIKEDLCV